MLLKENIPVKYIFGKIIKEIVFVTLYAGLIAILYNTFHFTRISIPIAVPTILGTVISLLLAFKSNQAYDRWWEARTLWGAIVNDTRTLTRQLMTFVSSPDTEDEKAFCIRLAKRQIAWCISLSKHLRDQNPLAGIDRLISAEDMEHIKNYSNVPLALQELQAIDIRNAHKLGWLNDFQQIQLDNTLTAFSNEMGGCERIKNTVFPATYSHYIHFSLVLFIMLLPFGLIEFFGVIEIPLVIAIASSFFLIEKMAIHLQDPFENKPTDTPTTAICRTIERDIKQMLKENYKQDEKISGPASQKSKIFYVL
ncbi:bestrophin family protein [Pedobacter antarcticus]|uniref:Membrane protein n=2 Tax=Pedobacter antarcticus TaxID=34086 RepID=A0A081PFY9_9SPHI|nr:bestrophin family ion channel [Pedobacter antarcticus]KEQ29612.1 membrane protein [Pedobacter antarcticus 4BY]SDM41165.1 putative membrane protein [Pedobacter antarcticus]SFE93211.1 putative membrane protein [Pedobacter antarcticus]